ncbi:unnamed protein product [Jaminaea pallidilutea]
MTASSSPASSAAALLRPSYAHTPFPDVSGLRTAANRAGGIVESKAHLKDGTLQRVKSLEAQIGWPAGSLGRAAFAAMLIHYTAQDVADIAFTSSSGTVARLHSEHLQEWTLEEMIRALACTDHRIGCDTLACFDWWQETPAVERKGDAELTLAINASSGLCSLSAASSIHNQQSADLFLAQWTCLLESYLEDGHTRPACSPDRLSYDLKAGDNPAPRNIQAADDDSLDYEPFEGQFLRRCETDPEAVALDFRYELEKPQGVAPNVRWTYKELHRRACTLADHLQSRFTATTEEPIVALCLPKSPSSYVAQLAVLISGAAWCPIDCDWPSERRQALLAKSGAQIVMFQQSKDDSLARTVPAGVAVIALDDIDWTRGSHPKSVHRRQSSRLAYKIWTSGTTGLPKAVGIEHSAAVQALRALQAVIPHKGPANIRYLQFSAYVFDLSILDCFYTWGLGGTLCACPREILLTHLTAAANSFKATHTLLTPAVLAMTPREAIPSLEVVINGGEKLTQVVADIWSKDCCLLNLYGPAEATLIAMHRRVPSGDVMRAPNIGVALPTISCHALDRRHRIVPKGAIGQLALGGFQCARGYIGDDEKTADKFMDHADLGRIYLTGDLARQLADGSFEYLGREDDQIKINGIRIETLEISAVVRGCHADVKDSETLALALDGPDTTPRIVNFSVMPQDGGQSIIRMDEDAVSVAAELRKNAQKKLPAYMVPSLFIVVTHFPRTSSAKVDRQALQMELQRVDLSTWTASIDLDSDENDVASGSAIKQEIESKLRPLISHVLGVSPEEVSDTASFPSVGLDSIKAMVLAQKLHDIGMSTSVVDIISHPSIRKLALLLGQRQENGCSEGRSKAGQLFLEQFDKTYRGSVAEQMGVSQNAIEAVLPTTPLQQGMLAETVRSPEQKSYWLNRVYAIRASTLQAEDLLARLRKVLQSIAGCRTIFLEHAVAQSTADSSGTFGQPFVQIICKDVASDAVIVQELADEEMLGKAKDVTGSDPTIGKPAVCIVVRMNRDGPTKMVLRAHHSAYDARSLELLAANVRAALLDKPDEAVKCESVRDALPYLLPLTEDERMSTEQCWQTALSAFPRGHAPPLPRLSSVVASASAPRTFERKSMTATVDWGTLSQAAQDMDTSVKPIAQCVWATVLAAYLDTEVIILGDSVSGRATAPASDNIFGAMHTTVPVPIKIHVNEGWKVNVNAIDDFHKSVLQHQHFSLSTVRKWLQLPPSASLFQSVFVFETQAAGTGDDDAVMQWISDEELSVEHPLAVELTLRPDETVEVGLIWRDDVMQSDQAQMLLEQYDACLKSCCNGPDEPLGTWTNDLYGEQSSLLSITAPRKLLQSSDAMDGVERWLAGGAQQHPDAVALEFWPHFDDPTAVPQALTYLQFYEQAKSVAKFLTQVTSPQGVVAVCLRRCPFTYVALLATQLSGCVYLPVDEAMPTERQQLLVKDSAATCVLTERHFGPRFQSVLPNATICHDEATFESILQSTSGQPFRQTHPHDLSYILYTSGSTGQPKGCRLTRTNLQAAIDAFRVTVENERPESFADSARFLARSAEAFDVALLEVFLPLSTGSTIVTAPRETILEDLRRAMQVARITHAAVVPSLFYSHGEKIEPAHLPHLRVLIVGGEPVSQVMIDTWAGSGVPLLNAYGPTETTIGNSIARLQPSSSTANIGRPFPGTQYLVMKENRGRLIPTLRGQPGELCIAGLQVGAGYLGRDAGAPFQVWNGQRIYRTGDLATLLADDQTLYLGRGDDSQVKIRGARLELKEIDAVLANSLPDKLLQVATLLIDEEGQKKIVAFISRYAKLARHSDPLRVDETLTAALPALQAAARSQLPLHMMPNTIAALTFLPLALVSGKVDAKRLRAEWQSWLRDSSATSPQSGDQTGRPMTEKEKNFVRELQQILSHDQSSLQVSLHHNVFALGLDSLSAIILVGRLRRQCCLAITVADLLASSTIEDAVLQCHPIGSDQAKALTARESGQGDENGSNRRAPCTPMQQSLLAQSEASSGALYVTHMTLQLGQGVDSQRLRTAIDATVANNDIWRTTFTAEDGRYSQTVQASNPLNMWCSQDAPVVTSEIVKAMATVPPVRFQLAGNTLLVVAHHALFDATTIAIFIEEIGSRYAGRHVHAGPSFIDAADAIAALDLSKAKAFWTTELEGCTLTPFPNLCQVLRAPSDQKQSCSISSRVKYSQLAKKARELKVTSQALSVAAFSAFFIQFTGEADSLFGLVLNGRTLDIEHVDRLQGPLLTTVPFRTSSQKKTPDTAKAVNGAILRIYGYQHTSLASIKQWLGIEQPLFNTLLSILPQSHRSGDDDILRTIDTNAKTEYPVAFELEPLQNGMIQMTIVYDPHLIPSSQADLLIHQLDDQLVQTVTNHQDTQDELLSIIPQQLQDITPSDHFLQSFRAQVARRPHALAIDFACSGFESPFERLTYTELDDLSDRLASQISEARSSVVGVFMQRSLTFYATLVAVWKSQKTYLPLDPSLPTDRLQYMIEASEANYIVSDAVNAAAASNFSAKIRILDGKPSIVKVDHVRHVNGCASRACATPDAGMVAYILFTSGSTGRPKPVAISHVALAAALASWKAMLPHSDESRLLQLASPSFDVSLIEICMPLAFGFTVASAPKDILLDDLEHAFRALRLTMADLPASLAPTVSPKSVPTLEWLMSGGDALDERVIRDWGPYGLVNAWGPTEATIGNTLGFVRPGSKRSAVGKAYPASSIFVLHSASLQPVYRGAIGELAIGGPQLADGYYQREDLTREAFVHLLDGTRVYRTGDRGRILADGTVEVLGRMSRGQVKLRGQRLELDEVSHAFTALPQVREAGTIFVAHTNFPAKQLVTWISLRECRSPQPQPFALRTDAAAVRAAQSCLKEVKRRLPSYMVPSHVFVTSGRLPLTTNQKLDYQRLEDAYLQMDADAIRAAAESQSRAEAQHEWSRLESAIRLHVADFCQIEPNEVSPTTSFYQLGLDSLSAIKLAKRLAAAGIGVPVTARDVLRWPNVVSLAAHLTTNGAQRLPVPDLQQLESQASQLIDGNSIKRSDADVILSLLPCTPLQHDMLNQSQQIEGQPYFYTHYLEVSSSVSSSKIETAWSELIRATDILRTSFHALCEGGWLQAVHTDGQSAHLAREQADLADCTLFPVRLSGSATGTRLKLAIHHALYDGVTLSKLFHDFNNLLQDRCLQQRPKASGMLPFLLPNRVCTQHWCQRLRGVHSQALPPPSDLSKEGFAESSRPLGVTLARASDSAKTFGVSLRAVATLAFSTVMVDLTGSCDVVMGQIVSLRDVVEGGEEMLGPCFNTLPIRVQLRSGQTNSATLRAIQKDFDEDRDFRNVSLRQIIKSLGLLSAPFDAILDYQMHDESSIMGDALLGIVEQGGQQHKPPPHYPLNIEVRQTSQSLLLYATADSAFFDQRSLDTLLQQLDLAFARILSAGDDQVVPLPNEKTNFAERLSSSAQATEADDAAHLHLEGLLHDHLVAFLRNGQRAMSQPETPLANLGFDSILSIRFASMVRQRSRLPLSASMVVRGSSVRGIARLLRENLRTKGANSSSFDCFEADRRALKSKLGKGDKTEMDVVPALSGQAFHLASWLNSSKRRGVYLWAWRTRRCINLGRLQAAWDELRLRQPLMRTTFASHDAQIWQIILSRESSGNTTVDAHECESIVLDRARAELLRTIARKPVDMRNSPAMLHAISTPAESLVILRLSHALYDAWSIEWIGQELEHLYHDRKEAVSSPAPLFSDFSRSIAMSSRSRWHEERLFWRTELDGVKSTLLVAQAQHESAKDRGWTDSFVLRQRATSTQKWHVLKSAKDSLVPLQHLFMASWACELAQMTRNPRPVFGLYHLGRSADFEGVEEIVGPCMNVLPMAPPEGATSQSLMAMASGLHKACQRRLPFEQSDIGKIHEWSGFGDRPMFDCYLNIIWGNASTAKSRDKYGDDRWQQVKLGNPSEYTSDDVPEFTTTLDEGMPQGLLTATSLQTLDVDIALSAGGGHVDVGVRANANVMNEDQINGMIDRLVARVDGCLAQV